MRVGEEDILHFCESLDQAAADLEKERDEAIQRFGNDLDDSIVEKLLARSTSILGIMDAGFRLLESKAHVLRYDLDKAAITETGFGQPIPRSREKIWQQIYAIYNLSPKMQRVVREAENRVYALDAALLRMSKRKIEQISLETDVVKECKLFLDQLQAIQDAYFNWRSNSPMDRNGGWNSQASAQTASEARDVSKPTEQLVLIVEQGVRDLCARIGSPGRSVSLGK